MTAAHCGVLVDERVSAGEYSLHNSDGSEQVRLI